MISTTDNSLPGKFKNHLKTNSITLDAIASEILTSKSHISRVLNGERPLSDQLRNKLNAYLGTDFKEPPAMI